MPGVVKPARRDGKINQLVFKSTNTILASYTCTTTTRWRASTEPLGGGTLTETRLWFLRLVAVERGLFVGRFQFGTAVLLRLGGVRWEGWLGRDATGGRVTARYETVDVIGAVRFGRGGWLEGAGTLRITRREVFPQRTLPYYKQLRNMFLFLILFLLYLLLLLFCE